MISYVSVRVIEGIPHLSGLIRPCLHVYLSVLSVRQSVDPSACLSVCLWDRVSCCPGWPPHCNVSFYPISEVLGLQVCVPTPTSSETCFCVSTTLYVLSFTWVGVCALASLLLQRCYAKWSHPSITSYSYCMATGALSTVESLLTPRRLRQVLSHCLPSWKFTH